MYHFAAILRFEIGWFDYDENNSSLVASRLAADATLVRAAVGDRVSTIMQNGALTVTAFVIAFVLQWKVTLVILSTFPLLIGAAIGEVQSSPPLQSIVSSFPLYNSLTPFSCKQKLAARKDDSCSEKMNSAPKLVRAGYGELSGTLRIFMRG